MRSSKSAVKPRPARRQFLIIEGLKAKRSGEVSIGRLIVGPAALLIGGTLAVAALALWKCL